MTTYIFDIDGTICSLVIGDSYNLAKPIPKRINKINLLYDNGHIIKMFTARGASTGKDWTDLTKNQLSKWGLKYHELIMNSKPEGDLFIDDKAINARDFF